MNKSVTKTILSASFIGACVVVFALALSLTAWEEAAAYETYSEDRGANNCRACHGDFRANPYTSLADGQSWGDDAHDVHRRTMLNSDCDACHASGFYPVPIGSSDGGDGLSPFGCVGCHGREEDGVGSGTSGFGAGLRQHHWRAGETGCVDCHSDSDPSAKTTVGEDVLPPYYANPGNDHPEMPDDSCNPSPEFPENFAGSTRGLDNDGDLDYDEVDSDCGVQAVCGNGTAEEGEDCDDGNTVDGDCCSSTCSFEPEGSPCDDGLFCNAGETCNGAGVCGGGSPNTCNDGVGCTVDSCDEAGDACVNAPDDGLCDNGLFCDGNETCDPSLDCQDGTPVDCDDADICTDDSCNEDTTACDNVFDATNDPSCAEPVCGDGRLDEGEQCDDGNNAAGDCCAEDCTFEAEGSSCDDGYFCNVGESCDGAGGCTGGTPNLCDDGVGCTSDACDETGDRCMNTPDDAACDNGMFCDGEETCDPDLDCQDGTPVDCDDDDICTDDACNEETNDCDNVFDPTNDPSCTEACPDDDGDGFADCTVPSCDPTGLECGDCDDTDPLINPDAVEDCFNGKDDDCDGAIDAMDEDCPDCSDADGDGYSTEGGDCGPVDCNDDDPAINPGQREICDDGADNDCDGFIDDADSDCAVSAALSVGKVLAPAFVRLSEGETETHAVKVFVRNSGDAPVRVKVLLSSDPADGVTIRPLGAEMRNIRPGQQQKFTFAADFTEEVLGGAKRMRVHFTAIAVDDEGRRSSPASPRRDTLVIDWNDVEDRRHSNRSQAHRGRRPPKN